MLNWFRYANRQWFVAVYAGVCCGVGVGFRCAQLFYRVLDDVWLWFVAARTGECRRVVEGYFEHAVWVKGIFQDWSAWLQRW